VADGVLGLLLAYRGEQRPAIRLLNKSSDAARRMGIIPMDFFNQLGLAVVAETAGRFEDAETHLLRLLETWRSTDDRHDAIPGLSHAVAFFPERSRPNDAAAAAEALDRIAASTINPEATGAAMAARGELRWLEGKAGLAVRDFQKAFDEYERRDLSIERIRVRLRLGMALQQTGNDVDGREMLLDARTRARRLGARPLAAKLDLILQSHSDTGVTATESWDLLSARQREVARHVAQGLTNKEIAARLGLSVRTVDMHVAHILERLDCRSRSQVAARVTSALA
jgi:DNA-binding CsgD family transcriptional regulator